MTDAVNIKVSGNVEGSIVVGDNNFVVNKNHGTIVYKQAAPQVQARTLKPQPPRPPRGFVNRTEELQKIEAWIAAGELALIYAPDGMGKSALLRQAANLEVARLMPDGVLLMEGIDVSGQVLGTEDVIQRLFDSLFESNPPLKVNASTARTYLSNTRPLLVFDEVALPVALQQSLSDLFPKSAMLFSADVPSAGEYQRLVIKPLPRHEALNLLAVKAELTLNDANRQILDGICAYLSDVALAIHITANVMRETKLTPKKVLDFLQNTADSSRDVVANALDKSFALAFNQLSEEEQKLLSAAAYTPNISMSPEWLSAALGGVAIEAFLERIKALGLLYANSPRVRLPAGFRGYARKKAVLKESDILPFLVEYLLSQQNPSWEFVSAELGNYWGAIQWAVSAKKWDAALSLVRQMDASITLHGLWDLWGNVLELALQAARQISDAKSEAWALHQMGTRFIGQGQKAEAKLLLNQALTLREKIGDSEGAAYTRHNIEFLTPVPVSVPSKNWLMAGLAGVATTVLTLLGLIGTQLPVFLPAAVSTEVTATHTSAPPTFTPTPADVTGPQIKFKVDDRLSQYGPEAEKCGGSVLQVDAFPFDPAGVKSVTARYRYEYGTLIGEWQTASFNRITEKEYRLLINHNQNDQALNVLDNLDGDVNLQITATDMLGNNTFISTRAPVRYARCDVTAPSITRSYTSPNPVYYGPDSCDVTTVSEMHTFVSDDSVIQQVYIEYYYRTGKLYGPKYRLDLVIWGSDGHYGNYLYHNENNQAGATLGESHGYFHWVVYAVDAFGNIAISKEFVSPILFCVAPG